MSRRALWPGLPVNEICRPVAKPGQFACRNKPLLGRRAVSERVRRAGSGANTPRSKRRPSNPRSAHPPSAEWRHRRYAWVASKGERQHGGPRRDLVLRLAHPATPEDGALRDGVATNRSYVLCIGGDREPTWRRAARVTLNFRLAMHIDTDEANAANVQTGRAQGSSEGIAMSNEPAPAAGVKKQTGKQHQESTHVHANENQRGRRTRFRDVDRRRSLMQCRHRAQQR